MSSSVAAPPSAPPRVEFIPAVAPTQGDDAAFLAAKYDLDLDDWQRRVLAAWMAERPDGKWAAPRCGLAVPRQNGKNAILEVRELYGMIWLGEKFLHTAHEVKTARKAFLRLSGFFENRKQWPELADLVTSIRKTNGQEAIVLANGGSVEFVARSRGSGRGYTVDTLVCDEAQELTDEQLDALLPTISSAPTGNPQTILTGTPPPPGTAGAVFARTRDAALGATDPRLAWHEWSVEGDVDITDRDLWAATNPALGIRLHAEVIESELTQLSDAGFARERLGVWSKAGSSPLIDSDLWESLVDKNPGKVTTAALAVDVTPDRSRSSVAFAGNKPKGGQHAEVLENNRGTGWVVDFIVRQLLNRPDAPVVLDASGPAGSLITDLRVAGIEPVVVSGREYGQACGAFYDAIVEKQLGHYAQPQLNSAVGAARKRQLGDAWAWHRKDPTVDISPLVAVTLAKFGVDQQASSKKRTGKVW